MLKLISKFANGFENYMNRIGRERARVALLLHSDRLLEDAGFSRELLESGVNEWPWRANQTPDLLQSGFNSTTSIKAIEELNACNDKELHDLGVSRGPIPEAVMHGREGIELQRESKAA